MTNEHQRYELGFPEMDEQHRYLYRLFDSIDSETNVSNEAATRKLLKELERYILFHFTCEEHLMRLYSTPEFAEHQSDHERVAAKYVQFLDDFDAGQLNPAALKIFLTGWLMEHSRISDAAYVKWILEQRAPFL